jgi:hypothetical protein
MCVEGWQRKRWNPAGIKMTTVEVRANTLTLGLSLALTEPKPV